MDKVEAVVVKASGEEEVVCALRNGLFSQEFFVELENSEEGDEIVYDVYDLPIGINDAHELLYFGKA